MGQGQSTASSGNVVQEEGHRNKRPRSEFEAPPSNPNVPPQQPLRPIKLRGKMSTYNASKQGRTGQEGSWNIGLILKNIKMRFVPTYSNFTFRKPRSPTKRKRGDNSEEEEEDDQEIMEIEDENGSGTSQAIVPWSDKGRKIAQGWRRLQQPPKEMELD